MHTDCLYILVRVYLLILDIHVRFILLWVHGESACTDFLLH